MKYLKRYNESVMNRLDKSSIEEILDIFNDLGDEGFDIINKDLLNNPSYSPGKSEITYQMSFDLLDDQGRNEYNSTYSRYLRPFLVPWDGAYNSLEIKNKYFNYYQQVIFNVNLESFSDSDLKRIKDICIGIYDRLISCGYRCQLWEPGYKKLKYHISTDESNPFMDSKNSIFESYMVRESLRDDAYDIFIDHRDSINIAAQYQNGEKDIVMYIVTKDFGSLFLNDVRDEVNHLVSHVKGEGYKLDKVRYKDSRNWVTIYDSSPNRWGVVSTHMDVFDVEDLDLSSTRLESLELKFSLI
jgi:hypothetical protein